MITLPLARAAKASVHMLDNAGFVLDVKGHKVVALRVSSKIAAEVAGDGSLTSEGGLLAKLKTKMSHASETEQWLAVTSIENPLLEDHDNLEVLIAQGLTEASGITVLKSDLAIAASIRI